LSLLDALVKAKRAELGLDGDDGKSGHAIEFPGIEPWPEPVDGAEVLDKIAKAIGAHVIMAEHSRDACALWAAHTFLTDRTMISPRLAFTSPTKGCGKTTALDVMGQLVLRPLVAANVSPSAIFRVVEACHPTLLIDEADSFLKDNEELRGVLNSGHRRGGAVLRTVAVGDDFEVRSFATYGAMVIALIGQLPGTLADRSVSIVLTRRKRSEAVTPFRLDRVEHLVVLARKLARWAKDNEEAIAGVEPEMPAGLYNRAADNWRPLLAIATVAAGDWLARGHKAALASAGADVDEVSRLELLLGDTRDVFDGLGKEEISSAHLIEKLVVIVPRPWTEMGKNRDKPLTQNKLARMFKPLGITPSNIGPENARLRGYVRAHFEEAFERFLSPKGDSKPPSRPECDEMGISDIFKPPSQKTAGHFETYEKPNNDGVLGGWAVAEGETGENARDRAFEVVGRAPAGSRCLFCGKGGEVDLVRRRGARELDHAHPACAEKAWGDAQPPAAAAPPPANGGDREAGVSSGRIRELADEYQERAYANARETGGDTRTAECDAWLRQRLADEGVRPEHIETEFERVMAVVFGSV
jgi:putative DNA primase/helicase